jgi:NAD(P)-dependent dehydrogenase (short-subunit alcohol dehydrogenase family)
MHVRITEPPPVRLALYSYLAANMLSVQAHPMPLVDRHVGNPAYNVAKAGVKVFTEGLQHQLRNTPGCKLTAHLLIPGFVFTGMTSGNRTEKPPGAWTPQQTVDFMLQKLEAGDFYILCPDNEVTRATDQKRIQWAAGDIVENRPPLSRWHPDYAQAFEAFK